MLALVLSAKAAECDAKGPRPIGASAIAVGIVGADAAGIRAASVTPPPLSAHGYTVLMKAGVIVAVTVYPAAVKVVVCVSTTVMGSSPVFGAAFEVQAIWGSLKGTAGFSEVVSVGPLGTRGSENVTVLRLDGDAAPPLTGRTVGVVSLSALTALGTMPEPGAGAVAGAGVAWTIVVS